ncbi:purine-nucleoside phosphorylase [Floccifex sp.]|uniref:purine-nucleoside phosphorylase n=1 Tax=Floccifex sp. TaxID=2815810 RepID=UPI002A75E874|nr:purine-nucleoside phosphorylase [Floccifex sp.]MDD7282200.1 purine-nucleoside phosphorylase [Erysipelotrichaceae bacterium]MDY2958429.1 purine-nucleoside phosphorylase [Floccifex sp.]
MSTPHNQANKGEIASVVLMPGDPLRAKFIAENYLEDVVCFNTVRNMLGYTGTYKGKKVSVMGSGMGMPSIGIYSYELYSQYDVDTIIRIGSAGGYTPDLKLFDVTLAHSSYSKSSYAQVQSHDFNEIQYPDEQLNQKIMDCAKKLNMEIKSIRIHSSDAFYCEDDSLMKEAIQNGCQAVEMESFALFHNAKVLHKKAAAICTISDSFAFEEITTPQQREQCFNDMMKIALEACL